MHISCEIFRKLKRKEMEIKIIQDIFMLLRRWSFLNNLLSSVPRIKYKRDTIAPVISHKGFKFLLITKCLEHFIIYFEYQYISFCIEDWTFEQKVFFIFNFAIITYYTQSFIRPLLSNVTSLYGVSYIFKATSFNSNW